MAQVGLGCAAVAAMALEGQARAVVVKKVQAPEPHTAKWQSHSLQSG